LSSVTSRLSTRLGWISSFPNASVYARHGSRPGNLPKPRLQPPPQPRRQQVLPLLLRCLTSLQVGAGAEAGAEALVEEAQLPRVVGGELRLALAREVASLALWLILYGK
jgi:hypothetical protein